MDKAIALGQLREITELRRLSVERAAAAATLEAQRRKQLAAEAEDIAERTKAAGRAKIQATRNAIFSQPLNADTIAELRATTSFVQARVSRAEGVAEAERNSASEAEKIRLQLAQKLRTLDAKLEAFEVQRNILKAADEQLADRRTNEDFVDQFSANKWRPM